MSQAETLALVATAVDNASGPLKQVRKALDDLARSGNLGVHQKEIERFRRELGGLAGSTGQLRQGGKHLETFGAQARAMSAQITAATATIGRGLIPGLGALGFASLSTAGILGGLTSAVTKYSESVRNASKVARESGFDFKFVTKMRAAAGEVHLSEEEMSEALIGFGKSMQHINTLGGGELGKGMRLSPEFRGTFEQMRQVMAGATSENMGEKQAQALEIYQRRINDLLKTNPALRVKEMIQQAGGDPRQVDIAIKGWDALTAAGARLAAKMGELDEAKAHRNAASLRELAASAIGLQNAIGNELIDSLTSVNEKIAAFIDANKGEITSGIVTMLREIRKESEYVVGLFDKLSAMTPDWLKGKAVQALPTPEKAENAPGSLSEGLDNMREHWFGPEGIFGTRPTRRRLTDEERARNAEPLPQVNVPQRFTDGDFSGSGSLFKPDPDFLKDSPLSSNIEDRRGYVGESDDSRAVVANTEQLVVLNRLLDEWLRELGGASGGSSSAPYRFTGGGAAAGPGGSAPGGGIGGGGMGGLPGMPAGIGGAGGPGGVLGSLGAPMGALGGGGQGRGPGGGPGGRVQAPGGVGSGTPFEGNPLASGTGGYAPPANAKQAAAQSAASALREQGLSENAIAGMLHNANEESGMDPTLRHADQPKFGGEAHFAHGLFQDGGDEWNTWSKDMQSRGLDPNTAWKDPKEQANFVAGRLKGTIGNNQYAKTFEAMQNAKNPTQAAEAFARGYLKPASQYLEKRVGEMHRNGVSGSERWTGPQMPQQATPQNLDAINNSGLGKLNQQFNDQRNQTDEMLGPQAVGQMPPNAAMGREAGEGVGGDVSFAPGGHGQLGGGQLQNVLKYAGGAAGLNTEITSGLERGHSGRHLGLPGQLGAHDVRLRDPKTGELLDMRNPEHQKRMAAYTENAAAAGATGIGAGSGTDYMGPHGIHVGGGPGAETVWGAGGRSPNAPQWLRDAYARGRARAMSPDQVQAAIDEQKQAKPTEFAGKPVPFAELPRPGELSARSQQAQKFEHNVTGDANLNVTVAAPRGTKAKADANGLFKQVSLDRTHSGESSPSTNHAVNDGAGEE